ncbi:hypothetical protein NDN08_001647 [Rhodosorus marinus]|uniref:DNA ligase (NAD(+)) n=1 Tax=Rhodosorus marinus TaxID=101924 RepID=A0AAV8UVP7_9RHOD|nr:hypothetical protein NDN08_001647 [Rhodosorus marinus]
MSRLGNVPLRGSASALFVANTPILYRGYLRSVSTARICQRAQAKESTGFFDDIARRKELDRKPLADFTREEYDWLARKVKHLDQLYYSDNPDPEVSDVQYDNMLNRVERLEKLRPEWIIADSPTNRPGYAEPSKNFMQVEHARPMLSLAKTYSERDLEAFVTRIEDESSSPLCVELKIDGVALRLTYRNGELYQAVTRGDGTFGDDVTRNAIRVQGIPKNLPTGVDNIEVSGEVCILREDFELLKKEHKSISNVRNSAAGALKLTDPDMVAARRLTFIAYDLALARGLDGSDPIVARGFPTSQSEALHRMIPWGFNTSTEWRVCRTSQEILHFVHEINKRRSSLPMEVDGIVVKLDDFQAQEDMGYTNKSPKWAVAHKFTNLQSITTVKDVVFQVSRYGVLTPVALLDPVGIGGVTITRATLNNYGFMEEMGINKGDSVYIERGGDVIPKIVGICEKKIKGSKGPKVFPAPKACPSCSSPVGLDDRILRCRNKKCPDQVLQKLIFFSSKQAMNIDGLGEKTIVQLVESNMISKPSDILELTPSDLVKVERIGQKKAEKIVKSIKEAAYTATLAQVIHAMSVPSCGKKCAEDLADYFKYLEHLLLLDEEDLASEYGFGLGSVQEIAAYFSDPDVVADLIRLRNLGVKALQERAPRVVGHGSPEQIEQFETPVDKGSGEGSFQNILKGKRFVFTGTLDGLSRDEAAKLVKVKQGSVGNTISKKVDYIVAGENAGKKLREGQELGLTILDTKEFLEIVR